MGIECLCDHLEAFWVKKLISAISKRNFICPYFSNLWAYVAVLDFVQIPHKRMFVLKEQRQGYVNSMSDQWLRTSEKQQMVLPWATIIRWLMMVTGFLAMLSKEGPAMHILCVWDPPRRRYCAGDTPAHPIKAANLAGETPAKFCTMSKQRVYRQAFKHVSGTKTGLI